MDDGNSWIGILLFAASVAVFYLIYGFGAAIQALNTSALEDERDEGNKKAAALLRIQEDPGKFVRTNQVVTCFFTLALGAFTLPQTAGYIRRFLAVKLAMAPGLAAGLALAAAFFAVAFFLVCLGVIIPKHVAAKSPIRFCYKALSVVEWAIKLLSPFTWLISVAAFVVLKAVGIDIRSSNEKVTEEDIMYMVNEGHDQGVLEASEAEMITNIFEFDDKVASDIMTHRKNVVALESTMTLKETVDFIVKEANNSRFPVYEEDIDNIVSIKPDVTMFLHYKTIEEDGKEIVAVDIQRGTDRPYYLSRKGMRPEGVYVRQGYSSVPATDTAIRRMIKETDGDRFEAMRCLNQELTFEAARKEFELRNIEFGPQQMRTLKLIDQDSLYSNLGLLLSDQCVHTIKVAKWFEHDRSIEKNRR